MIRQIGIIGAGECSAEIAALAEEVGRGVALKGAIVITGGLGGVMEAASRGAKAAGGRTVGILPGFLREEANPYVDIAIVTGMDHARNILIVRSAEVVIAIGGGYGTLSEIALALKMARAVVGLQTWENIPGVQMTSKAEEAVVKAFALLDRGRPRCETV